MRYNATREALFSPGELNPNFPSDIVWSRDARCAELSRLAYIRFEKGNDQQRRIRTGVEALGVEVADFIWCAGSGTQAFCAMSPTREATVVFRGTQSDDATDIGTDAEIVLEPWDGFGRVHHGFRTAFDSVWSEIDAWLVKETPAAICFTGHSLGAALATIAASRRPKSVLVTFGSPRVGDVKFAHRFDGREVARYVNCCDIVTRLPPEILTYEHVQGEKYINSSGTIDMSADSEAIEADRNNARLNYLADFAWKTGLAALRDLADHAPINYVSALLGIREQ